MKDIEIIKLDYTAKNKEYKKEDNVDLTDIPTPWIVPEEGPFYGDSLRVIKGGLDLVKGKDFKPIEPVTDLEKKTGHSVYMYIELEPHIHSVGGKVDVIYQKVGHPIISIKKLLDMLEEMVIKGKDIDWDTQVGNKPDTYYPAWHSHDIKSEEELVGFGGLVELFSRMTWNQLNDGPRIYELIEELENGLYDRLNYIQKLRWGSIMSHALNYKNPHKVKKGDVQLSNLQNYPTATIQQDLEGERTDLYSTPAGLKAIIDSSEPDSEEFLFQNELPFSYYGSGIYLPPPITGSFEGLGGDYENSSFIQEGNGWVVGLIRGYDGRVRNLYYVYNTNLRDGSSATQWIHTYVQYKNPVINNTPIPGSNPVKYHDCSYVINGSNNSVLVMGDASANRFWICNPNNTMDSASHAFKPTNLEKFWINGANPNGSTVAHVGDWVYVIHSISNTLDNIPGFDLPRGQTDFTNYQRRFLRARYSDLSNPDIEVVEFQPVNVSFETTERERYNNRINMIPNRYHLDENGKVIQYVWKYPYGADSVNTHRRQAFFIVPDPNNPRYAHVKTSATHYSTFTRPDGSRGDQDPKHCIDYIWDVENNIWTLHPDWEMCSYNVLTSQYAGSQESLNRVRVGGLGNFTSMFSVVSGSWIQGYGYVALISSAIGTPPYSFATAMFNKDGDISNDFESVHRRSTEVSVFIKRMIFKSPFGVTGAPRFYSDLYNVDGEIRDRPIEIFIAENEDASTIKFYRITESGPGDDQYSFRPELQSNYVNRELRGRKTNSQFGVVTGETRDVPIINRPRAATKKYSRGSSMVTWFINRNRNGAKPSFSIRCDSDGNSRGITEEADGTIHLYTTNTYSLDISNKRLNVKGNIDDKVYFDKNSWYDQYFEMIGVPRDKIRGITVSISLSPEPGLTNKVPPSMFSIMYQLDDEFLYTRSIVGVFRWSVEKRGDKNFVKFGPISYPVKHADGKDGYLAPGGSNKVSSGISIGGDGYWSSVGMRTANTYQNPRYEILDLGNDKWSVKQFTGLSWRTVGNQTGLRVGIHDGDNGVETQFFISAMSAYNGEVQGNQQANPEYGWMMVQTPITSGGAMCLMVPVNWNTGTDGGSSWWVMYGATYVEGNWAVFVNAEITTTFNGYSVPAKQTNWDLRDATDEYKNQTFYIYCCAIGSTAEYELTKVLKPHNPNAILVATIKTDDLGIATIERRQGFSISGYSLTRSRDSGIPVSSGSVMDKGSYRFLKKSELFKG